MPRQQAVNLILLFCSTFFSPETSGIFVPSYVPRSNKQPRLFLYYYKSSPTNHLNSHTPKHVKLMMQMNKAPFYRTQWGIPQQPPRYNKAPSKVVRIPVHFVGSDRTRTESAVKIQKVTRGFIVRKSVKKMVAIRVELEQIENNVHAPETVELIRRENRERVRVSESIMNLLLRLDSVRVLHYSALRDCRKSLIKRAIALQELVDQMVDVGPTDEDQHQATHGTQDTVSDSVVGSSEMFVADSEGMTEEALGNEKERVGTSLVEEENFLVKEEEGGQVGCEEHEESKKMEALRNEEKMGVEEKEEDGEGEEESVGTSLVEEGIEENCLVKEEEGEVECEEEEEENFKGGDGGKMELLERMMEDNQKMMEMMAQLFERNEMQTRLLSSLTQRVEQLERTYACDKLRRKNRRNADAKHNKESDPKKGC